MKRLAALFTFLISTALASAYHDTTHAGSTTSSGGGSWVPIIVILAVFIGGLWALWAFVLEDDKF